MDVLLKKNVENLGERDEIVSVRPGYGRNFLIPQGLAILATSSVKKMHEETLRQCAHKLAKLIDEAKATAEKLKGTTIKVGAKVGENGKIFGSVTNLQVADALKAAGFEIDRKSVVLKGDSIKSTGTYEADAKIHKEVIASFKFEVVEG
ncbi:MAG: 50S ribosomal protein L9 [Flavobacteriales bacterium]